MKEKKLTILFIFLICIFAILSTPVKMQNDTFYLIKVGENIIKNGLTFVDNFSIHGELPYLYPHFLFSIIVYLFYNCFSFTGLYILTIIFAIILSLILYRTNVKFSKNLFISFALTILSLIYLNGFITLRAQIVSYTIFILEYYILNKLIDSNKNKYILFLFLLAILIVNTHVAVYPFYLIIFLPFFGEYIIKKILKRDTFKLKKISLSFILASISGFISPIFYKSYTYLYNTLINDTTDFIEEHAPTVLSKSPTMIILLLIIILMFVNKKFKLEIKEKLLLLGLTYMALSSVRHQSLLIIFTVIILCKYIGAYLKTDEISINEKITNFISSKKGILITCLTVLIFCVPFVIKNVNNDYIDEKEYPVQAVEYIKKNLDYKNIRLFNSYNSGSYILLNDIKVFIDSRSDLYTYSYNKTNDIFNAYTNIMDMNVYYEGQFEYYNIDYILLPTNSKLVTYLGFGSDTSYYTTEYIDANYILLKRRKF